MNLGERIIQIGVELEFLWLVEDLNPRKKEIAVSGKSEISQKGKSWDFWVFLLSFYGKCFGFSLRH